MKHRKLPHGKDRLSVLGFGCMRFPTCQDGSIDEAPSMQMLQYAFDHGVNYFDTAWVYHNDKSEEFLGRFLAQGIRDKVYIATKLPCWLIKSPADFDLYLDQQLQRLRTDRIDYYLLHSLNRDFWKNLRQHKVFDWLERAKRDGRIRFAGFSFHDNYALFKRIVDAYAWDFCQIQLNYYDTGYQAGLKGMHHAANKGLGVIVMEPLRGGKLALSLSPEADAIWTRSKESRTNADRALRWLWNYPQVTLVLSGMSTLDQVKENVKLAGKSKLNCISGHEQRLYQRVRRTIRARSVCRCTGCGYCLPCPSGVAIPFVFDLYESAHIFPDQERRRNEYLMYIFEARRADKCTQCGACLSKCPQSIDIPKEMVKLAKYFSD